MTPLSPCQAAPPTSSAAARRSRPTRSSASTPGTGAARRAGTLGEPLSDLGAVSVGGRVYLVGGYTGSRFATAVLRFRPGRPPALVARLPAGLRYAGVAALGGRIYVAGGVTTSGDSSAVLAVDPVRRGVRLVATLPTPVAHAPLVALERAALPGRRHRQHRRSAEAHSPNRSRLRNGDHRRSPTAAACRRRRRVRRSEGDRPRRGGHCLVAIRPVLPTEAPVSGRRRHRRLDQPSGAGRAPGTSPQPAQVGFRRRARPVSNLRGRAQRTRRRPRYRIAFPR